MPIPLKYWLIQLPGIACVTALLYFAHSQGWISVGWLVGLLALWVIKDAAMYSLTRDAYRSDNVRAGELTGIVGTVRQTLAPHGTVWLHGALWKAQLAAPDLTAAEPGTAIRVKQVRGLTLIVERQGDPPDPV